MYYIIRYGEIALKGANRREFEKKLIDNIRIFIKNKYDLNSKITSIRGRILIDVEKQVNLQTIFGIVSYSPAIKLEKDIEVLKTNALSQAKKFENVCSFKVETHRLDKSFPLKSPEVSRIIGEEIFEKTSLGVDLKNPELLVGVEIHSDSAYLYSETIQGQGGLPLGSSSNVIVYAENSKACLLSCLNIMRRGSKIILSKQIELSEKDKELLKLYNNYIDINFLDDKKISKYNAIAFYWNFKDITNNLENIENNFKELLFLFPIALLNENEVNEGLNYYEKTQINFNSGN